MAKGKFAYKQLTEAYDRFNSDMYRAEQILTEWAVGRLYTYKKWNRFYLGYTTQVEEIKTFEEWRRLQYEYYNDLRNKNPSKEYEWALDMFSWRQSDLALLKKYMDYASKTVDGFVYIDTQELKHNPFVMIYLKETR